MTRARFAAIAWNVSRGVGLMSAMAASGRTTVKRASALPRRRRARLVLLGAQPLQEARVRRGPDRLVELSAVVRDEAHALDGHVVDEPAPVAPVHPVLDRDLGALLRDEPRANAGGVVRGRVTQVDDALAAVGLELADVRALQQVGEQPRDLVALVRRAPLPVGAETASSDLGEVEGLVRDLPHGDPALGRPRVLAKIRVLEDADDLVDRRAELVGRRARPRRYRPGEDEDGRQQEPDAPASGTHATAPWRGASRRAPRARRPG